MNVILVAAGGALGGIARYLIGKIISLKSRSDIPFGTFAVNLSGAFFLGIVKGIDLKTGLYLFVGAGFLGAFTTFSTFMYEGFDLFADNEKKNAVVYILTTLILGIIGYIIGFISGGFLVRGGVV